MSETKLSQLTHRFRGFLPVIIDVETAGFNAQTDALLEIAAVIVDYNENYQLAVQQTIATHVMPFEGANLDQSSLAFTGIDPHHPFRFAISEREALKRIFEPIQQKIKRIGCSRAILVGHNPCFDLAFIKAAGVRF